MSRCGWSSRAAPEAPPAPSTWASSPCSEQDAFRATAVLVPARMDPLQGVGGGPTQPGTYQFTTRPPVRTTFTVAGDTPTTPQTPGTLPFAGPHTPMLLTIGSGLLVAGAGLLLLVRRQTRRTA